MSSNDKFADRGQVFIRMGIPLLVLSVLVVAVRFWSRTMAQRGTYGMDDWTCLFALVVSVALCGCILACPRFGLGRHVDVTSSGDIETDLKLLYAAYFLFQVGTMVVKSSALLFYGRVFGKLNRRFTIALYCTHAFIVVFFSYLTLSLIFNCTPTQRFWNRALPGHCLNEYAWYLANVIVDVLIDLWVLVLPVPMIWRLQMSYTKRVLVVGAFLCGYCSIVVTLGRLVTIVKLGDSVNDDFSWTSINYLVWSFAELPVGIISICLPSWFHLIKQAKVSGVSSLFRLRPSEHDSSLSRSRRGITTKQGQTSEGFARLVDNSKTSMPGHNHQDVRGSPATTWFGDKDHDIPLETIEMRRDVAVELEERRV